MLSAQYRHVERLVAADELVQVSSTSRRRIESLVLQGLLSCITWCLCHRLQLDGQAKHIPPRLVRSPMCSQTTVVNGRFELPVMFQWYLGKCNRNNVFSHSMYVHACHIQIYLHMSFSLDGSKEEQKENKYNRNKGKRINLYRVAVNYNGFGLLSLLQRRWFSV